MPETRIRPRAKPQRAAPPPPALLMLGAERLILPEGRVRRRAWPELAFAMLLEPEPDELAVWIGRLEVTLGVNDDHRVAMQDRAVAVVESSADKRRRLLDASRQAARVGAKVVDPELAEELEAKQAEVDAAWDAADQLRADVTKRGRRALRTAESKARRLEGKLDEMRQIAEDVDRLYGEAAGPIRLARQRGEEVQAFETDTADFVRDEHGARVMHRVRDRQRGQTYYVPKVSYSTGLRAKKLVGIEHAFVSGYLGNRGGAEKLRAIADDYGEAYEIDEGQKSGGGEGGGGFGPKGPQVRAVEAAEMLETMRKGLSRRERRVLDLVCGEHMRVREVATIMSAGFPATVRALRGGLKKAGESWRAAKEAGTVGKLAGRVRDAHRLVSRMRH